MITAVVLAKNAAASLSNCLDSLKWCDSVLVIDDNSIDDTAKIAKRHGAQILTQNLNGDFAAQRNRAMEQVTDGWILFVDADEVVPVDLANEIRSALSRDFKAYHLHRQDIFMGQPLRHGETSTWNDIRLAKSGVGQWVGQVHETWDIHGSVGQLTTPLIHHGHSNIGSFLAKINTYSTLAAAEFFHAGKRSSAWQIILYPAAKFVQNYIFRLGFLDGTHGFVHAMCMSFHSFLVRSKLYLLAKHSHA